MRYIPWFFGETCFFLGFELFFSLIFIMEVSKFPLQKSRVGYVIGKKGRNLKTIRRISGVKDVHVENEKAACIVIEGEVAETNLAMRIASSFVAARLPVELLLTCQVFAGSERLCIVSVPIATQIFHLEECKSRLLFRSIRHTLKERVEDVLRRSIRFSWSDIRLVRVTDSLKFGFLASLELHTQLHLEEELSWMVHDVLSPHSAEPGEYSQGLQMHPEYFHKAPALLDLVTFVLCTREINENVEILMVQEKSKLWFLPAGHVDPGESFSDAGIREAREESGLDVSITGFVDIIYELDEGYSALHCLLTAKECGGTLKSVPGSETLRADWFPLSEIVADIGSGSTRDGSTRGYRKPFEIGPMISRYAELIATGARIPCISHCTFD